MTQLKFGNRSAYCDFDRAGDGTNGYDYNGPDPSFACRIRNSNPGETTADALLESELSICAPEWPAIRCPAEQARAELRYANNIYRAHLRNRKNSKFHSEVQHWTEKLETSRKAYTKARQNLRAYISALDLTSTSRFGVFFWCDNKWIRSSTPYSYQVFADYVQACKQARRAESEPCQNLKYRVLELDENGLPEAAI